MIFPLRFTEISLTKVYKDSHNIFKLIFDRNHRPDYYNEIISNNFLKDENQNIYNFVTFSCNEKIEISRKLSENKYINGSGNDLKEREYLSSCFISRFNKVSAYFFGLLFGMNLFLLRMIRIQLNYKIPYKAKDYFINKMKKLNRIRKILFYSLIIYEIGFGLLAINNYRQYEIMKKQIIPEFEKDLITINKPELEKYENCFFLKGNE